MEVIYLHGVNPLERPNAAQRRGAKQRSHDETFQRSFPTLNAKLGNALSSASASARDCVKSPKFFKSMGQRHTFKAILIENLGIDLKFTSI
jgi:hypothetical protein